MNNYDLKRALVVVLEAQAEPSTGHYGYHSHPIVAGDLDEPTGKGGNPLYAGAEGSEMDWTLRVQNQNKNGSTILDLPSLRAARRPSWPGSGRLTGDMWTVPTDTSRGPTPQSLVRKQRTADSSVMVRPVLIGWLFVSISVGE